MRRGAARSGSREQSSINRTVSPASSFEFGACRHSMLSSVPIKAHLGPPSLALPSHRLRLLTRCVISQAPDSPPVLLKFSWTSSAFLTTHHSPWQWKKVATRLTFRTASTMATTSASFVPHQPLWTTIAWRSTYQLTSRATNPLLKMRSSSLGEASTSRSLQTTTPSTREKSSMRYPGPPSMLAARSRRSVFLVIKSLVFMGPCESILPGGLDGLSKGPAKRPSGEGGNRSYGRCCHGR